MLITEIVEGLLSLAEVGGGWKRPIYLVHNTGWLGPLAERRGRAAMEFMFAHEEIPWDMLLGVSV